MACTFFLAMPIIVRCNEKRYPPDEVPDVKDI
jgi:hypothetical protein